jgi:hypothetical protein
MRTIDAVHAGENVGDEELKRMADAAARIADRNARLRAAELDPLRWLSQRRLEVGLTRLASELEEDKSNLLKVISGVRHPSNSLLAKIKKIMT